MNRRIILTAAVLLLMAGCAAPVKLITPPTEPLGPYTQFMVLSMKNDVIGKIDARVTRNIMSETAERIQDLEYFKTIIVDDAVPVDQELLTSGAVIRRSAFTGDSLTVAVLNVTLTDYNEGSALLRFFFAPFAGMGKVGCDLVIVNGETQKELVKARTVSSIGGIASGADQVVTPISKAIKNVVERYFVKKMKK